MPRDDYYDDDPFGDEEHQDEDAFGEEEGFSEVEFDEELEEHEADGSEAAEDPADKLLGDLLDSAPSGARADDQLAWRETYFILFQKQQRPTLTQVESCVGDAGPRLEIQHLHADDDGLFQSVLVHAPEDNAALEVSYEEGEAVMEQSAELAKQLQKQVDSAVLAQLLRADARLDVMHFERMDDAAPLAEEAEDEIALESLNPATLISVVEALADLTGGVPVDPSAGEIMV